MVLLATPDALGVAAGCVAQHGEGLTDLGDAVHDPGWQYRVAAGDPQPCQGVSQCPMPARVGQALFDEPALAADADLAGAGTLPGKGGVAQLWTQGATQGGEEVGKAAAVFRGQQEVQADPRIQRIEGIGDEDGISDGPGETTGPGPVAFEEPFPANQGSPPQEPREDEFDRDDEEVGRELNDLQWNGAKYMRVDLDGRIAITNRTDATVRIEVRRLFFGKLDEVSGDGTKRQLGLHEDLDVDASERSWWHYSWLWSWWSVALNGVGEARWTVTIAPGEEAQLTTRWHYMWR